ncbi:oligosaccharide flippase family protein [Anaerophaga thermohalophila]|uniref:oligosaccharide flippase family protein n=1 Tax=Anaerophaga thermohalophila TaxID=177400 RepID=UPI0021005220|nr:polysaccharide biosynthesis C-terminal domain-containing protein [Anaerophaga thermohalophila]
MYCRQLFSLRILSFLLIVPLLFFQDVFSQLLFGSKDFSFLVLLLLILVPVNLMMSEQSHLFRYFRQPWRYNLITVLKSFTNIGLGISLVIVLKQGVEGAMWARIGSSFLVVVVAFAGFNFRKYSFRFSMYWARQLLKYGFPLIWVGIATWVFNSSDRYFLLHYRDLDEVGLYSIGAIFSQPVLLVNMAVQMSFGVLFFQSYYAEEDALKPRSRKMAIDLYLVYLAGGVLLATVLSVFADILVPFVTTTDYSEGARVVPFLVFSYIAAQSFQTMGPGISLSEKTWHYTWITGLTALLNIGLNFLLVPLLGFLGAGVATLLSFVVYWQVKVWVAARYFPVEYPFRRINLFFTLGLSLSVVVALCPDFFDLWLRSAIVLVVAASVFLLKLMQPSILKKLWLRFKKGVG